MLSIVNAMKVLAMEPLQSGGMFHATMMHAGRYFVIAGKVASSGYKSQRKDRASGGENTGRKTR
jgi:hypothetical protein